MATKDLPRLLTKFFKVEVRVQMNLPDWEKPLHAGAACKLPTLCIVNEHQVDVDDLAHPPACMEGHGFKSSRLAGRSREQPTWSTAHRLA